jgi:hypothetical protein
MYFVVIPRVNLIVILMTYVRYLYSINCPTVICLPSMLLFILWRDTTSELWTPVQFLYIAITIFYFTCLFTFLHTIIFYHSIHSILCLQQTSEIEKPHHKLGQSSWLCCVQVPRCWWWRSSHVNYAPVFFWHHCLECREASEHQPSEVWLSSTGLINLGFTTEGNLLLCSSYLPLGAPNWVPNTHYQVSPEITIIKHESSKIYEE